MKRVITIQSCMMKRHIQKKRIYAKEAKISVDKRKDRNVITIE